MLLLLLCVAGIFISVAVTRYGSRIVGITGSVTGLIGFALGSCATSILHMYLAVGLLAGLCFVYAMFAFLYFLEAAARVHVQTSLVFSTHLVIRVQCR